MRGEWSRSFSANSGGFLLAGYSLVAIATCVLAGVRGWPLRVPNLQSMTIALLVIVAITMVDWSIRLAAP